MGNRPCLTGVFGRFFIVPWLALMLNACGDSAPQAEHGKPRDARLSDQELSALQAPAVSEEKVYRFGFDLRGGAQEDARQYLPLLQYLERATGYHFKLRFTSADEDIVTNLGTGKVQFAAIGAVSFIAAQRRYKSIALVRGINAQGETAYRSYIVVRPDSPIKHIEDLRRQHFAFGSKTSTQGYLIPRIVLQQHGLTLDDLAGYSFTGSHQSCAEAVMARRVEACGMQDTLAERFAEQGDIRILDRSEYYPSSGIAASRTVPAEVIAKVKAALLAFDPSGRDAEGLYAWERTEMPKGFAAAQPEDYRQLEAWMDKFKLKGRN
jgi:phosphonate transport system substrate-binding protein